MKITIIVVVVLAVLIVGYIINTQYIANPRVADELRNDPEGARAARVMLLTFDNGKMIPVNYLREGDTVFVGADGPWWRAFRGDGAPVSLFIKGEDFTGHATVVLDDQAYVDDVFARLRPAAPDWLPDWLNGKLVVIALDTEA